MKHKVHNHHPVNINTEVSTIVEEPTAVAIGKGATADANTVALVGQSEQSAFSSDFHNISIF
jgi:hypothetical protein